MSWLGVGKRRDPEDTKKSIVEIAIAIAIMIVIATETIAVTAIIAIGTMTIVVTAREMITMIAEERIQTARERRVREEVKELNRMCFLYRDLFLG